jgi:hypothetical protein
LAPGVCRRPISLIKILKRKLPQSNIKNLYHKRSLFHFRIVGSYAVSFI